MGKTTFENRKDSRGGGYSRRKFTFEEAETIREEYKSGQYTQHRLAEKYKVSQPLIAQILLHKTYCKF
tara:strand:- start:412 stop:615 length:204 start_codon:yes stop_codon:yes gene_type:complete